MGKKYETLVETNTSLADILPTKGSIEYCAAGREADLTALRTVMAEIIGITNGDVKKCTVDVKDSLLGLLIESFVGIDPNIYSIVRSCGCALKLDITV